MKNFLQWLAAAATLSFAVPCLAGQNDPRLGPLFEELKEAKSPEESRPIESAIWQIWLMSGNGETDAHMFAGIQAMASERNAEALAEFSMVIDSQPDFAEGWNKRATVNYLLGRYDASVADIQKTLALEPRHFGALSGLGLINLALGRDRQALQAFEAALAIHPNMAGADGRIQELRNRVKGKGI